MKFYVGDILKSKEYSQIEGAKITKLTSDRIYLKELNGKNDDYPIDIIEREIKRNRISLVPRKITNWKERLR